MIFDCVLTACDTNPDYLAFLPLFFEAWDTLFPRVRIVVCLIANEIPASIDAKWHKCIELCPPIGNMNTAFHAQCIRILYPALLTDVKGGIMITDVDMIPTQTRVYVESIKQCAEDEFLCFPTFDNVTRAKQYNICYCCATSKTWAAISKMKTRQDVEEKLRALYKTSRYQGISGGQGWYTDQQEIFRLVQAWNPEKVKRVRVNISRLCRMHKWTARSWDVLKGGGYHDCHMRRPPRSAAAMEANARVLQVLRETHPTNEPSVNRTAGAPVMKSIQKNGPLKAIVLVIDSDSEVYTLHRALWRSYMHLHPHVQCFFLRHERTVSSAEHPVVVDGDVINVFGDEGLHRILHKTIKAFEYCLQNFEFDFMLRTNLSSLWKFDVWYKRLQKLPRESCSFAVTLCAGRFRFPSGAGFTLSKDVVQHTVDQFAKTPKHELSHHDDVAIGYLLSKHPNLNRIESKRLDIGLSAGKAQIEKFFRTIPEQTHHVRLKMSDRASGEPYAIECATRFMNNYCGEKKEKVGQPNMEPSIVLILTATVNVHDNINCLAQTDCAQRQAIYEDSVRNWMRKSNFRVVLVENSGFNFESLKKEFSEEKNRFEYITFTLADLSEADQKILKNTTSKGFHEVASIRYAMRNSNILAAKNKYTHVIKLTGRYFIPALETLVKEKLRRETLALRQADRNRCEFVGCSQEEFERVFEFPPGCEHVECTYKDCLLAMDPSRVVAMPGMNVAPVKNGGFNSLVRQL